RRRPGVIPNSPKNRETGGSAARSETFGSPLDPDGRMASVELHEEVSSAGESHPRALPEPYVNVSAHTAPIISRLTVTPPSPSGRTAQAAEGQGPPASASPGAGAGTACISSVPIAPAVG